MDFRRQGGDDFLQLRLLPFGHLQRRLAQSGSGAPPPKMLGVESSQRRTFEGLFCNRFKKRLQSPSHEKRFAAVARSCVRERSKQFEPGSKLAISPRIREPRVLRIERPHEEHP